MTFCGESRVCSSLVVVGAALQSGRDMVVLQREQGMEEDDLEVEVVEVGSLLAQIGNALRGQIQRERDYSLHRCCFACEVG